MMERLTKKFTDGNAYCEEIEDVGIKGVNYPTYVGKAVDKLAEYEDLEEQGLLLKLPCKFGDIVYMIINQRDNYDDTIYQIVSATSFELSMIDNIGKTVFLTKAEAEQKLKEMDTNNDLVFECRKGKI